MSRKKIIAAVLIFMMALTVPVHGASGGIQKTKIKTSLSAGAQSVTIKWKKVKTATGYQIYRATSKKGKYKRIKVVKKASTVKYTNKKLKAGKKYYYKVRAYQKKGKKIKYSKFSSTKSVKPLTRKEFAKKCIGKSVNTLIAGIGKPYYKDYAQSCFGPGQDGMLKYKGFIVYTYRENGKETVQSVE